MEDYRTVMYLGQGTFGSVWKVLRHADKKIFAVKKISVEPTLISPAYSEVQVLKSLDHPCIVKCFDYFEYQDHYLCTYFLCIVMEYCNYGTLHNYISRRHGVHFQKREILDFFCQLTLALEHIHSKGFVHRDLKPHNILMSEWKMLKVSDFGLSKELSTGGSNVTPTQARYEQFMAPEVLRGSPYATSADVWSLGCILYELIELQPAFDCKGNIMKLMSMIENGAYPPQAPGSEYFVPILAKMINIDVNLRPQAGELLDDCILQGSLLRVKKRTALRSKKAETKHELQAHKVPESSQCMKPDPTMERKDEYKFPLRKRRNRPRKEPPMLAAYFAKTPFSHAYYYDYSFASSSSLCYSPNFTTSANLYIT